MKLSTLFQKSDESILDSISTYKKALMEDINLTLRLTYNEKTYATRLVEWSDSIIIFEAPMTGTDDVILPSSTALDVILVAKIGLFHTTLMISKNYREHNKLYYVAEISAPIVKKQQREAFRLDVTLDVQYTLISSEETNSKQKIIGTGTCVNISLGGMCLITDHQFHSQDEVTLSFSLVDTPLTFVGEVLYLGERTEQGTYTHRIRFIDLDDADTNQLNRLIFQKQRLQLKRS